MNFDKEYERVFGVKTPTPSTSFRTYPWYPIHDILGLDEGDEDGYMDMNDLKNLKIVEGLPSPCS